MNKDLILHKLQDNLYLSIRDLAKELEVSYGKMHKFLSSSGIKTMSVSERLAHRNKVLCTAPAIEISEEANQLIIGSILGDGSVIRKRTNCKLSILHSKVQEDYIRYKYDLFRRAGLDVKLTYRDGYESRIGGRTIKNNGRIILDTKVNQAFNKYREQWYQGKKCVPDSVYELKDLGLAIWFMDDGTSNISSFYLSTQCFSLEDNEKLVNMMQKNFDIKCSIHRQKSAHILYICATDKAKFIEIVKPYICPCMNYKIIGHNK